LNQTIDVYQKKTLGCQLEFHWRIEHLAGQRVLGAVYACFHDPHESIAQQKRSSSRYNRHFQQQFTQWYDQSLFARKSSFIPKPKCDMAWTAGQLLLRVGIKAAN
jgi:hypothetical protein